MRDRGDIPSLHSTQHRIICHSALSTTSDDAKQLNFQD